MNIRIQEATNTIEAIYQGEVVSTISCIDLISTYRVAMSMFDLARIIEVVAI